jgi:uncharacterized phage protein (TIGR01671 family)
MNREIKFRAFTMPECEMTYSDEYENIADFLFHQFPNLKPTGNELLMQYTGLKDKNGKEIYEGDVLQIPDNYDTYGMMAGEKRAVIFMDGGFRFESPKKNARGHWLEDDGEFEVIGNIYENPELISNPHNV